MPAKLARIPEEAPYEWSQVGLKVDAGAWRGEFIDAQLLTDEIVEFLRSLSVVLGSLTGNARLRSMESWTDLNVNADHRGGITLSGFVRDATINQKRFYFSIQTDQSFVSKALLEIEKYV